MEQWFRNHTGPLAFLGEIFFVRCHEIRRKYK